MSTANTNSIMDILCCTAAFSSGLLFFEMMDCKIKEESYFTQNLWRSQNEHLGRLTEESCREVKAMSLWTCQEIDHENASFRSFDSFLHHLDPWLFCLHIYPAGRKDFQKPTAMPPGQIITSAKVQATSCHLQVAPTAIATQSLDPEKTLPDSTSFWRRNWNLRIKKCRRDRSKVTKQNRAMI